MRDGRPVLGDFYSSAGGAARGYQQAGWYVIGVDNRPQPRYAGDEFVQGDALTLLGDPQFMAQLDAAHASPPCQARSKGSARDNGRPRLIGPTRSLLQAWGGGPWVIENVPSRRRVEYLRPDVIICGCQVGIDRLERERWFETSWQAFDLRSPCTRHSGKVITVLTHGARIEMPRGGGPHRVAQQPQAEAERLMGIDWMTQQELGEAIPPAYTKLVGALLMQQLACVER